MTTTIMTIAIILIAMKLNEKEETPAILKTKAEEVTYETTIALNTTNTPPTPTIRLPLPTSAPTPSVIITPTPTEIIIATDKSLGGEIVPSSVPTSTPKTTSLPASGISQYSFLLAGVATLIIFLAFIF